MVGLLTTSSTGYCRTKLAVAELVRACTPTDAHTKDNFYEAFDPALVHWYAGSQFRHTHDPPQAERNIAENELRSLTRQCVDGTTALTAPLR